MEIKGTYHCQTTQQPNTLNSWDIRSVSVELPEQDKPYWHKIAASVIGGGLVAGVWVLKKNTRRGTGGLVLFRCSCNYNFILTDFMRRCKWKNLVIIVQISVR